MGWEYKIQEYQTEAARSVVDVFEGQPKNGLSLYRRDLGKKADQPILEEGLEDFDRGFKNSEIVLSRDELLQNIQRVQAGNAVKQSPSLSEGLGKVALDIEMETGTGKTYVYIKTMFELHKAYGWNKYIVVVPSIAIREGVNQSFASTQKHFMEQYGTNIRYFIYNSSNLHELDAYSQSADINVMIINIQAFNTSMNEEKNVEGRSGNEYARIIYSERDEFRSRRPIDVISANRPILILDEPQKMGSAESATQRALKM